MTGYQDYLIILSPPDEVSEQVKRLKYSSSTVIGEYDSLFSKAHISIQPWMRKKPEWVTPLIPKLQRDLQNLPPITLNIDGFAYFDQQETATIYAKLVSTPATKAWFKSLRKYFNTPSFEPHITVARSISKDNFNKLWPYFNGRPWQQEFKVDRLTILCREHIGYQQRYKIYREMPFNPRISFDDFMQLKLKAPHLLTNWTNSQQFSLF
ncbi:2'-5' RNA ligase family protein [Mucilaginibacter sp. X4EP1]|uniref:2'-5' RNA ligase family protein n=1 Tax=Mucilaginibacter sp. X4EP1 TaxID=2723092 RepID=UPI002166ED09|nr:2'-5' RNA ligase family protein [Mucilaginibacter sp. X4EP1]MCS3815395.1 2'-5' RNA ligase [Mucilaginibacter sp. X4EP1]